MTLINGTIDEKKDRLTAWWNGESQGRPMLDVKVKNREYEALTFEGEIPEGITAPNYTTKSLDYRCYLENERLRSTLYYGDSIPHVGAELAAGAMALFYGCRGSEGDNTVWIEPDFKDAFDSGEGFPEKIDRQGFYFTFYKEMFRRLRKAHGQAACCFPDLVEGIDIYASMRDTQSTLMDVFDRPDEMLRIIGTIDDEYLRVYDELYEELKDDRGGTKFWAWAPGRIAKLQCDIAAMLSPDMYDTFFMPTLEKISARLDYTLYHLDGPDALDCVDSLLSCQNVDIIQWEPGASHTEQGEGTWHPMWFPLYRRFLDAGKKVFLHHFNYAERFGDLKREFGSDLDKFYFQASPETQDEAEKIMGIFM